MAAGAMRFNYENLLLADMDPDAGGVWDGGDFHLFIHQHYFVEWLEERYPDYVEWLPEQ